MEFTLTEWGSRMVIKNGYIYVFQETLAIDNQVLQMFS